MVRLEREGIEPVLQGHSLKWSDLGIARCKLFYRRRVLDMPLSDISPDAPPKRAEALRQARIKILDKARRKYLFDFQELRVPTGIVIENGHLAGVEMSRTEVSDGTVRTLPNTHEVVRSVLTVSSIGSIPESIPGIPQRGEVYEYVDMTAGLLIEAKTAVYAAGNVLTGKGNIKDSLDSGSEIGTLVAERYLGLADDGSRASLAGAAREEARQEGERIAASVKGREPLAAEAAVQILRRVRERQRAVGYEGNYRAWIAKVTPSDLQ
jgi:hypothetical protein